VRLSIDDKLVLQPVQLHNIEDDDVDIMKDYMLRMGRKLNGIKDQAEEIIKPGQTRFNYTPVNFMLKKDIRAFGVLPMFF
jgi:hypothetical protein